MNILFVAPYVPSRIRVRPFHFVTELARRHKVYVVALGEPGGGKIEGAEEIERLAADIRVVPHSKLLAYAQSLVALPTPYPMCAAFCWSRAMSEAVNEALMGVRFDVAHIEHIRAAHFAPPKGRVPVVFDAVDCLTGLFAQMARSGSNPISRLVMAEETFKLRRYEPSILRRFERVIVTSETEQESFKALESSLDPIVVPNGVDTDYFAPLGGKKHPHGVAFSGKMSYHPNTRAAVWFAQEVFPALRAKHPDATFAIIGSDPPPEIARLERIPGVTVTGYVPDIRPHLDSCAVAVAPMTVAVGIQNKVLEAMAMGMAVVATPAAARPFGPNCAGLIESATSGDMIEAISSLFNDPVRTRSTGEDARRTVLTKFSWTSSVGRLEEIYESASKTEPG